MNNVQKSQTLNNIECLYPEPFLLLTDGLYIRDFSHREDEYRFISNFLPIIDSVIEYDNGKSVEKNYLVKGFMVDGRTLPTVNVDSSELLTLNWVVSKWDASCIIGTQYGAREKLRYAMQTTTGNAKRRVQCGYTGWKKIDGRWNYLLPGHPSCEVILRGKLRSYLREDGATDSDYAVLTGLLQVPIAPRELLYTTLALVFLSPLNEFLRRAEREPKFIPAIVGRTGSMKTSYAAFLLSFFGNFSSTDMPMSFRDTANSIIENSNALKDVLTCVDDYHPSTKGDEATMRSVMQVICRGYGDRAGRSRMNSQAQLMDASPPRGNAIITAESTPNIGESTTARLFFLEMNPNCLDLKLFSEVQKFASDGVFILDVSKRHARGATLFCTGRDIESREMELTLSRDTCAWELISDTLEEPELTLPGEMSKLIELMKSIGSFNGGNTELAEKFNSFSGESISAKSLKQMMNRWRYQLEENGVYFKSSRSNGQRFIEVKYIPFSAIPSDESAV